MSYQLLIHDSGSFVVKHARTLEDLNSTELREGVQIHGRHGSFVWSIVNGAMVATDVENPILGDESDISTHRLALSRHEMGSRLGRSLLTFGIEAEPYGTLTVSGAEFKFEGEQFAREGEIYFTERDRDLITFEGFFEVGSVGSS